MAKKATQPKNKGTRKSIDIRERIIRHYIDHLMLEGCRFSSVYKFCKNLGIREKEFYEQFNSFYAVDKEIWKNFIQSISALSGRTLLALQENWKRFSMSCNLFIPKILLKRRHYSSGCSGR